MSIDPEDDLDAAEFALGTLDAADRSALAARRQREPELDAAIRGWEARLAPLAEAGASDAAERDFLPEIQARIRPPVAPAPAPPELPRASAFVAPTAAVAEAPPRGAEPIRFTPRDNRLGDDGLAQLRTRLARWRAAAIAASCAAALLLVGFVSREQMRESAPHEFVAVLQKSADSPAFAISVNIDTREFSVRPVSAPAPDGKSYELWIIEPKLGPPRSLGVIAAASVTRANRLNVYDPAVVADATYAVTLEPPGGSPDGKPSGPPVFVGKLIPVGP